MFNNRQTNIIDNIKQNCPESCFSDSRCCFRGLPSCRGATLGGNTSLSGYWPAGQRGCSSAWPLSVDVGVFKWEVCPASGRKQLPHIHSVAAAVPRLSDLSVKIRGFGRVQSSLLRSHKYLFVSMVELFYTNFNKN